jgi:hypothetical protein
MVIAIPSAAPTLGHDSEDDIALPYRAWSVAAPVRDSFRVKLVQEVCVHVNAQGGQETRQGVNICTTELLLLAIKVLGLVGPRDEHARRTAHCAILGLERALGQKDGEACSSVCPDSLRQPRNGSRQPVLICRPGWCCMEQEVALRTRAQIERTSEAPHHAAARRAAD